MPHTQTQKPEVLEALAVCLAGVLEEAHDLAVTPLPGPRRQATGRIRRLQQAGQDSAILAQAIEVFSRRA